MNKKSNLSEKKDKIKSLISKYKKVLIAYSGGVDSTLLLKLCIDILGNENVIAATANSLTYTSKELETAQKIATDFKVKHYVFETDEFNNENFLRNPPERCYFCKTELFEELEKIKKENHCDVIMDGANYEDKNDFRPGTKAEKEFGIVRPLYDAFFIKKDIREYSKELRLVTHDYPSIACLASRIPYNERITKEKILRIKEGEDFLLKFGFTNLRLRSSENTARIEVDVDKIKVIIQNKKEIVEKLKSLGYTYITVDLEGFRSGSMNEIL